nr:MAG TPA: hypothetical protein [Caudoviricetes sp.]
MKRLHRKNNHLHCTTSIFRCQAAAERRNNPC